MILPSRWKKARRSCAWAPRFLVSAQQGKHVVNRKGMPIDGRDAALRRPRTAQRSLSLPSAKIALKVDILLRSTTHAFGTKEHSANWERAGHSVERRDRVVLRSATSAPSLSLRRVRRRAGRARQHFPAARDLLGQKL